MSDWNGDPALGCGLMIFAVIGLVVIVILGLLVGLGLFVVGVLG